MPVKTFADAELPLAWPIGLSRLVGRRHEDRAADTTGGTPVTDPGMLRNGGWIATRLSPSTLQATP